MSTHDATIEQLARDYPPPSRVCNYCGEPAPFPDGRVVREDLQVSPGGTRFRPDLSVLDANGQLIATIEVIDTHEPRDEVIDAEANLRSALYVHVDGRLWCSAECWQWGHAKPLRPESLSGLRTAPKGPLDRFSILPRCDCCDRLFGAISYPHIAFIDWNSPGPEICIECALQHLDGTQYKSPDESMAGSTVPEGPYDTRGLFLALTDAVFWAKVWSDRASDTPANQASCSSHRGC